jgi:hypothetical protein
MTLQLDSRTANVAFEAIAAVMSASDDDVLRVLPEFCAG